VVQPLLPAEDKFMDYTQGICYHGAKNPIAKVIFFFVLISFEEEDPGEGKEQQLCLDARF
jgi:hypothetical protein